MQEGTRHKNRALRYDFRSRYERKLEAGTKKAQTSGARLRIADKSGHSSLRNSTLKSTNFAQIPSACDCDLRGQLLVNALTAEVGTSLHFSGKPTNQELSDDSKYESRENYNGRTRGFQSAATPRSNKGWANHGGSTPKQ